MPNLAVSFQPLRGTHTMVTASEPSRNTRPTGAVLSNSQQSVPFERVCAESPTPVPTRRLKRGPPKHPAAPILGLPARASAVSATKSPIELPHARTVRPRIVSGTPSAVPTNSRPATSSLARMSVQMADDAKAKTRRMTPSVPPGGASFCRRRCTASASGMQIRSTSSATGKAPPMSANGSENLYRKSCGAPRRETAQTERFHRDSSRSGMERSRAMMNRASAGYARRWSVFFSVHPHAACSRVSALGTLAAIIIGRISCCSMPHFSLIERLIERCIGTGRAPAAAGEPSAALADVGDSSMRGAVEATDEPPAAALPGWLAV
eukprot:2281070-Prymnesium_polylepis.2